MAAIPVYFFFAQTLLVPGSLFFKITNSKRYHSCICRGLEHVVGHNLTMQIKVEILYYRVSENAVAIIYNFIGAILYCTNKIIMFFCLMTIPRTKVPSKCNSARKSALKMLFRARKCPFPSSSTVPFFNPGQNTGLNVIDVSCFARP